MPVYVYYTHNKAFVLAVADIQPDPTNGVHYWSFAYLHQGGLQSDVAVVTRPWGKLNQGSVTISDDNRRVYYLVYDETQEKNIFTVLDYNLSTL